MSSIFWQHLAVCQSVKLWQDLEIKAGKLHEWAWPSNGIIAFQSVYGDNRSSNGNGNGKYCAK